MKFDSCSQLTIISRGEYDRLFSEETLQTLDVKPGGYGGTPITMMGYFRAHLSVGSKTTEAKVYVSLRGDNLLSWPHQKSLGIKLDPNAQPQVQISCIDGSESTYVEGFKSLFSGELGCLKGYEHHIRVKVDSTTHIAKVRRIPQQLHERVEAEIGNS